jgi:hypothetical protein
MDVVAEAEVGETSKATGSIEDAVAATDHQAEGEVLDHQAALEVPISCLAIEAGATLH